MDCCKCGCDFEVGVFGGRSLRHLCFIVSFIVRQLTVTVKIVFRLCFKQFVLIFDELLSILMC